MAVNSTGCPCRSFGIRSWFMSRFQLPEYIMSPSAAENPAACAPCSVWFSWTMSRWLRTPWASRPAVAPKPRTASGARWTL
jgi:hypothetical protein